MRIRTVRRELGPAALATMARKDARNRPEPVWVRGRRFAKEPVPATFRTVKVRLDLKLLSEHGIDPLQVLSLVRQISDDPALRQTLFLRSGFVSRGEAWEIGANFIRLLADTIYRQRAARETLEAAA